MYLLQFIKIFFSFESPECAGKIHRFNLLILFLIFIAYLLYPFQDLSFLWKHAKIYYFFMLIVIGVALAKVLFNHGKMFSFSSLVIILPFIFFIVWSLASIAWSEDPSSSYFFCLKYAIYLFFSVSLMFIFRKISAMLEITVSRAMALGCIVISGLYLVVFYSEGGFTVLGQPVDSNYFKTINTFNVGFGGGRNLLTSWLCFNISFTVPILFLKTQKTWLGKMVVLFVLPVMVLTFSRTAILGLMFFFLLCPFVLTAEEIKYLKKIFPIRVIVLLILCILCINPGDLRTKITYRFVSPFKYYQGNHMDGGVSGREVLWKIAWQSFQDNPVMGTGVGVMSYRDQYAEDNYHNIYLQFMAQLGLIGLSIFLLWSLSLFSTAHSLCHPPLALSMNDQILGKILFLNLIVYCFKACFMFQYFDLEIWTIITFILVEYEYKHARCRSLGNFGPDPALQ